MTVGGLAGLDAAAATPAWGTMADRLLAIDAVLDDGTVQRFGPFGERSRVALTSGRAGQLVSGLFGVAAQVATDIHQHWPAGMRVPDGYLLDAFHPRPSRPYTPDGSVQSGPSARRLRGNAGLVGQSAPASAAAPGGVPLGTVRVSVGRDRAGAGGTVAAGRAFCWQGARGRGASGR